MSQPSDSDPFADLQFDLIDEEPVEDESQPAAVPPPRRARTVDEERPEPTSVEAISIEGDDAEIFARDTAVPSVPPDEYAAVSMRSMDLSPARTPQSTVDTFSPGAPSIAPCPVSAELEFADFGHPSDLYAPAIDDSLPPTPMPEPIPSEAPTTPPGAAWPTQPPPEAVGDTTRNPRFVEAAAEQMVHIPDSHRQQSPLQYVDSHDHFAQSLSPSAGLSEPPAPQPANENARCERQMREAFDLGDYTNALQTASEILQETPEHPDALAIALESRTVLTQMLAARIGPLDQIIKVVVTPEEMQWLALDHRSGFLLSLVDGQSTVDEILDISGMTRHDALSILVELQRQQVIELS